MNRLELRIMNKQNMDKRNYAFDRTNFTLLAIGFAIVVIGFILMSGSSSTEQAFNPDIFSFRRIKVAPVHLHDLCYHPQAKGQGCRDYTCPNTI